MSSTKNADTSFDHLERRCPRLGSLITFRYCRDGAEPGQPCFKVLDCWWEAFDVAAFCRQNFPAEIVSHLVNAPPPNKVAGLVDLIEQARKRMEKE